MTLKWRRKQRTEMACENWLPSMTAPKTDVEGEALGSHHALMSLFVLFWGGNFILAEVALREMTPITFSVSRFVMGAAMLVSLLYIRRAGTYARVFPGVQPGDWPRLLAVSVLGGTLAPWLGIEGLALTHGARASLWLALGPALSSAIGYFWHTERIGWIGYTGIGLAGFGTFALAAESWQPGGIYWWGDLLLFTALLLTVVELHLIKPLVKRYGAISMAAARTGIGGLLYLLIAAPSLVGEAWLTLDGWTWFAILFGGAIGVGVGQWVRIRALRALGPTRVVIYNNLVPLATLMLAWLTIGTNPSLPELAAGTLIVVGTFCLEVLDAPAARSAEVTTPSSEQEAVA